MAVFVGGSFDVGTNRVEALLLQRAAEEGHHVHLLPFLRDWEERNFEHLIGADVVITSPSWPKQYNEERLARRCIELGVPFVLAECSGGEHAIVPENSPLRHASLLLVAAPKLQDAAVARGYKRTIVKYAGPPPQWGQSRACMLDKPPALTALHNGQSRELTSCDNVLTIAGTKDLRYDRMVMPRVLASIDRVQMSLGKRIVIAYRSHPGIFRLAGSDVRDVIGALLRGREYVPIEDEPDLPSVIAASRLTLFLGAAPEDEAIAAHARLPTAHYYDEAARRRLHSLGLSSWWVVDCEGTLPIFSEGDIAHAVTSLWSAQGAVALRKKQEAAFPDPATWETAALWLDEILKVLSS